MRNHYAWTNSFLQMFILEHINRKINKDSGPNVIDFYYLDLEEFFQARVSCRVRQLCLELDFLNAGVRVAILIKYKKDKSKNLYDYLKKVSMKVTIG